MDVYTLLYLKGITDKDLLYNRGHRSTSHNNLNWKII